MSRYAGKVTIVTGGSKGIGEGCVRVFVKNGSKVVFCAKEAEGGNALMEELNGAGPGEALYVQCDVTKEEDIKRLINTTVDRVPTYLENPPGKPIDDVSAEEFRSLFDLNVVSYFLASKNLESDVIQYKHSFALPYLRETQGNIINNSSLVAHIGQEGAVSYVTTKGAICAMTRALAVDEAKHSVRVNAFSPGNVWTPLWEQCVINAADSESILEAGKDAQLLGRMGTIEECGQLCLYLAAEATFLTGVDIPLSGGAELNYGNKNRIKGGTPAFA